MEGFLVRKAGPAAGLVLRVSIRDAECALQEHPRETCVPPSTPMLQKIPIFFCHSKVITGDICPEKEEEGEQTSQKVGFFLLYNQL